MNSSIETFSQETPEHISITLKVLWDMFLRDVVICTFDGLTSILPVSISKLPKKAQERKIIGVQAKIE